MDLSKRGFLFSTMPCTNSVLRVSRIQHSSPAILVGCWTMTRHHELGPSHLTQRIASPPSGEPLVPSFSLCFRASVAWFRFSNRNIPLLEALLTLAKPMTSKFLIATRSLVPHSTPLAAGPSRDTSEEVIHRLGNAASEPSSILPRSRRPLPVLLVELAVAVVGARLLPLNEKVADLRSYFERIAVRHDQVCKLALLDCPELVGETKHLRRVHRDRLQRFVVRQSIRNRRACVLREPPREARAEARERDGNSGRVQFARERHRLIVRSVLLKREAFGGAEDDRNFLFLEEILLFPGLGAVRENHFQILLRAEFHCVANVASLSRDDEHGKLAFHDRHERFQLQVALEMSRRALFLRLRVMARAVEPVAQVIHRFVVFLLGVRVGLLFEAKRREIECPRDDRGPVDDHGHRPFDLHF